LRVLIWNNTHTHSGGDRNGGGGREREKKKRGMVDRDTEEWMKVVKERECV
jgi:hypothetical protein